MIFIIGTAAAVFTTAAFAAQVVKTHRTKHTKDISIMMYLMISTGTFLWIIYGLMLMQSPIIIANAITLALNLYVVYMKVVHG